MQALHPTECTVFLMLENSSLWKRLNSCGGQGPSSPQTQSRCWTGAQPEGRQRWSPSPAHPVSSASWSLVIPSTGFLLGVRLAKLIYEVKKKLSVMMKAWKKTGLDTAGVALGKVPSTVQNSHLESNSESWRFRQVFPFKPAHGLQPLHHLMAAEHGLGCPEHPRNLLHWVSTSVQPDTQHDGRACLII